jgi:hypothetical protein
LELIDPIRTSSHGFGRSQLHSIFDQLPDWKANFLFFIFSHAVAFFGETKSTIENTIGGGRLREVECGTGMMAGSGRKF